MMKRFQQEDGNDDLPLATVEVVLVVTMVENEGVGGLFSGIGVLSSIDLNNVCSFFQ